MERELYKNIESSCKDMIDGKISKETRPLNIPYQVNSDRIKSYHTFS